jgi:hypothetical protein
MCPIRRRGYRDVEIEFRDVGRVLGSFTQARLKNSERVGEGWESARRERDVGDGTTRIMSATVARRGSGPPKKFVSRS